MCKLFIPQPKIILFFSITTTIFLFLLYNSQQRPPINLINIPTTKNETLLPLPLSPVPPGQNLQFISFVYDTNNWIKKSQCIKYQNSEIKSFNEIGEGFWEINPPLRPINNGVQPLMYGTFYAQKIIYDTQHPKDCSNVKFIYANEHPWGLGSQLHAYGAVLGLAVDLKRILIYGPLGKMKWTNGPYCGDDNTYNCFFYPPGNCSPTEDMLKERREWDQTYEDQHPVITIPSKNWNYDFFSKFSTFLPVTFLDLLHCSPIPESEYRWWWRTQSMTYIIRPNPRTLEQLDILEKKEFPNQVLISGTIGMHVRHGDKYTEMHLVPFQDYVRAVEHLVSTYKDLNKFVYLGTEDPSVIQSSEEINNKGEWHYSWLTENRENLSNEDLVKKGDSIVLHALLGLKLQILADAHVGTLGSNWCRLIMELSSTIGYCAGCPFVDVGAPCSTVMECKEAKKDFFNGRLNWK